MEAASAVHWINTLMSFEVSVGIGTGVAGTQARMRARVAKQIKILLACKGAANQFDFFMNARVSGCGGYRRLLVGNYKEIDYIRSLVSIAYPTRGMKEFTGFGPAGDHITGVFHTLHDFTVVFLESVAESIILYCFSWETSQRQTATWRFFRRTTRRHGDLYRWIGQLFAALNVFSRTLLFTEVDAMCLL
jgi:hypothetical protein